MTDILADWYFCCCFGTKPAAGHTILSIFAVLDDDNSDEAMVSVAYGELARTEVWPQVYALPYVLRRMREHSMVRHRSPDVDRYLTRLHDFSRGDARRPLRQLLEGLRPDASLRSLPLLEAVAVCLNEQEPRPIADVPYLDIPEFVAESLLAAVVENLLLHNRGGAIATMLELGQPLGRFVENALAHRHGRLAFRIAVRIASHVGATPSDLRQQLMTAGTLPLEPDLLLEFARVLAAQHRSLSPPDRALVLLEEASEQRRLWDVRRDMGDVPEKRIRSLRARMGIPKSQPGRDLPSVFWQLTLWASAANEDPLAALQTLAPRWRQPADGEQAEWTNPWIPPQSGRPRYVVGDRQAERVVTLLGGTLTALHLLQAVPEDAPERKHLALLAVHAADALWFCYGQWLDLIQRGESEATWRQRKQQKQEKQDKPAKGTASDREDDELQAPLTALALSVRSRLSAAGAGRLAGISPATFVELLEQLNDTSISPVERDYIRVFAPRVLVRWISDAFQGAKDDSGPGRWLPLVADVYRYHAGASDTFHGNLDATMLMRFLAPGVSYASRPMLDWRKAGRQWNVSPRQLFAVVDTSISDWQPEGWQDDTVHPNWDRLPRAIERVSSLDQLDPDKWTTDPRAVAWLADFRAQLKKVGEVQYPDRFVRLRLIELLDHPVLKEAPEDQLLISLLTLEFASTYGLVQLFQRLFPADAARSFPEARLSVQLQVARALVRWLDRYDRGLHVRTRGQSAQPPHEAAIDEQQADVVRELLLRLTRLRAAGGWPKDVSDAIEQAQARTREARASDPFRRTTCQVDVAARTLTDAPADLWRRKAIVVDPNEQVAALFSSRLEPAGIFVGIGATADEWKAFHEAPADVVDVLATVVTWTTTPSGSVIYTFNWGGPDYLTWEHPTQTTLLTDHPVRLRLARAQDGAWSIAGGSVPEPLRQVHRSGEHGLVALEEALRFDKRVLHVDALGLQPSTIDAARWDPDGSRWFRKILLSARRTVPARLAPDGWAPLDGTLRDLLARGFVYRDGTVALLTLVEELDEPDFFGWRACTDPGDSFLLRRTDFATESAAQLDLAIEPWPSSLGLLITVQVTVAEGTPLLELTADPGDDQIEGLYPAFRAPIDPRNLEWRDLFSPGDYLTADRDGNEWVVNVDEPAPPGYPRLVPVLDLPVGQKFTSINFQVASWHPEGATPHLVGTPMSQYQVRPETGWRQFLDRWLDPRPGDVVQLSSIFGRDIRYPRSTLPAATTENVSVMVIPESLTMRGFGRGQLRMGRRAAEIVDVSEDPRASREVFIDVDEVPASARRQDSCAGILTERPQASLTEEAVCEILWREGPPKPVRTRVRNLGDVRQGVLIEGILDGEEWRFYARLRFVVVRALWTLERVPSGSLTYLGEVDYQNGHHPIAESAPGLLVLSPSGLPDRPSHLTTVVDGEVQSGIESGARARAQVTEERVKLDWRGLTIVGKAARRAFGDVEFVSARMRIEERGPKYLALFRDIEVARPRRAAVHMQPPLRKGPTEEELWAPYSAAPFDLDVDVQAAEVSGELTWSVLLPAAGPGSVAPSAGKGWTTTLPVRPDHGPLIPYGAYEQEGAARLIRSDGEWTASFQHVTRLTSSGLLKALGASLGRPIDLRDGQRFRLHYCGVDAPSGDGQPGSDVDHLFEFGFGRIARIPGRKLRFDDRDFQQTEMLLYYGDRILELTFVPAEGTELHDETPSDQPSDDEPILAINEVNLEFSDARELYQQRTQHSMVHLLRVRAVADEVHVTAVEGFDTRVLEDRRRSFKRVHATVKHSATLRQRLQALPPGEISTIYGRLDAREFEISGGRSAQFEHVRLSFTADPNGASLHSGERLFLQAGNIQPRRNDIALLVGRASDVHPDDVGSDMRKAEDVRILRRRFSVREDLLRRIYDDPTLGPKYLSGRLLLARLSVNVRKQIEASLLDDAPLRRSRAFGASVRNRPARVTVREDTDRGVLLEIRPGIFVRLTQDEVAHRSEGRFEEGAILLVETASSTSAEPRFSLRRSAYGDSRYLAKGIRSAVLLPKNNLFRHEGREITATPEYWGARFTVGDLPSLQPVGGSYSTSRNWTQPTPKKFVRLMQQDHPKLVSVGTDRRGGPPRVAPAPTDVAGMLRRNAGTLEVGFEPLPGGMRTAQPLLWRQLTFADESVAEVMARVSRGTWRYHDQETPVWQTDGSVDTQRLPVHNGWQGPLFFKKVDGALHLRYPVAELLRFGLPADVMLESLRLTKTGAIEATAVGGDNANVWVEFAPGRVIEVPGAIVEQPTIRTSLETFAWSLVAPGDRLSFALRRGETYGGDTYGIDTLHLIDWKPGPRAAFGDIRALLPFLAYEPASGALHLGAGDWRLILPVEAERDSPPQIVSVTPDNEIAPLDPQRQLPNPGDVVMMQAGGTNGLPVIAGWPWLRPLPSGSADAAKGLGARLVRDLRGERLFNFRTLLPMLAMFDGALPVTVEGIDPEARTMRVSLASLDARIEPGQVVIARLVGYLADGGACVLRCGGLLTMPFEALVPGVPLSKRPAVVARLKAADAQIWLHVGPDGSLAGGIRPEPAAVFRAVAMAVSLDEEPDSGVLVRSEGSLRFYWLPLARSGWLDVPAARAEELLVKRPLPPLCVVEDPRLGTVASIVDTEEATQLFATQKAGDELTVRVVAMLSESADVQRYVAESFATRTLLLFETRGSRKWPPNTVVPAEVYARTVERQMPRLVVVPAGERPAQLDLPKWMVAERWSDGRSEMMRNLLSWDRLTDGRAHNDTPVTALDDQSLSRALFQAYHAAESPSADRRLRAEALVALAWVQRNIGKQELLLPLALMAVLVLDRTARTPSPASDRALANLKDTCRETALKLMRDLSARSRRSLHVEVLSRRLASLKPDSMRVWARLAGLRDSLSAKNVEASIKRIRQFCDSADLHSESRTIAAVADSLSAATGRLDRINNVARDATFLTEIVKIGASLPGQQSSVGIHPSQIERLRRILHDVSISGVDVTLLPAID